MESAVRRTVEPFTIAVGNPARVTGVNRVGLSRRGCADDVIDQFESFLKGRAELPTGLPVEVVEQITAWTKVISAEKE
ncbi:hypothetical protein [Micromonospora sp. ATCC 39149]|uniref:hypothetical protein n=1 Tax=Micromonospora sp. (strain ATCC 39149 / NRRL 15099 / SCC 1413) TaxID=219305 RepID=UPI001E4C0A7D|nr:hypothetical protein [Micromonospora sp. ATCC 39149]